MKSKCPHQAQGLQKTRGHTGSLARWGYGAKKTPDTTLRGEFWANALTICIYIYIYNILYIYTYIQIWVGWSYYLCHILGQKLGSTTTSKRSQRHHRFRSGTVVVGSLKEGWGRHRALKIGARPVSAWSAGGKTCGRRGVSSCGNWSQLSTNYLIDIFNGWGWWWCCCCCFGATIFGFRMCWHIGGYVPVDPHMANRCLQLTLTVRPACRIGYRVDTLIWWPPMIFKLVYYTQCHSHPKSSPSTLNMGGVEYNHITIYIYIYYIIYII